MYIALFVSNLKKIICIFTIVVNANTSIFVVSIFKFINIVLKKVSKLTLFLFLKYFICKHLILLSS